MTEIDSFCSNCKSRINKYDYYITGDQSKIFCSENCMKSVLNEEKEYSGIYNIRTCKGYDYCKQLGNLRNICVFKRKITKDLYDPLRPHKPSDYPNWCSPSEVSMIVGNMKLLDFIKKSEEESRELNQESLKQNKLTNYLTWVILAVSILNLVAAIIGVLFK